MLREIIAIAVLVLVLGSSVMYLALIRPIRIELITIEKELLDKRLEEEQECARIKESMKVEQRFKLECIEIY